MRSHFLRMSLALTLVVTTARSYIIFNEEICLLLCDSITFPGPKMYNTLQMCGGGQVCMQIMNYTADFKWTGTANDRHSSILYLTRYCADAARCSDHCIFSGASGRTPIVSCVSCMNSTAFGFDGNMITYAYCTDDRVVPPPDNAGDYGPPPDLILGPSPDYEVDGPEPHYEVIYAPPPERVADYPAPAEYYGGEG